MVLLLRGRYETVIRLLAGTTGKGPRGHVRAQRQSAMGPTACPTRSHERARGVQCVG